MDDESSESDCTDNKHDKRKKYKIENVLKDKKNAENIISSDEEVIVLKIIKPESENVEKENEEGKFQGQNEFEQSCNRVYENQLDDPNVMNMMYHEELKMLSDSEVSFN